MKALLLACALVLAPASARAQQPGDVASDLPAAVAQDSITVGSTYRGSIIDVWGVNPDRRGRGDVVVVVRGPNQPATVMRKRRVMGLWINADPVRFSAAPGFFAVLSARPLRDIASPQSILQLQLDPVASAELASTTGSDDPSAYRAALVRLRARQGLYIENRRGVQALGGGLFRARVQLPANAPIAEYHADTYLFRNGVLISSQRIPVRISRIGVERRIHDLAMNYSFMYGLLMVFMALAAGWLAAFLFKRS